jgi:hypothetical protein
MSASVGLGVVLGRSLGEAAAMATIQGNNLPIQEDTIFGIIWNILPCRHSGQLGLAKRQDLGMSSVVQPIV